MRRGFVITLRRVGDEIRARVAESAFPLNDPTEHSVEGFDKERLEKLGGDVRAAMVPQGRVASETRKALKELASKIRKDGVLEAYYKHQTLGRFTVLFEAQSDAQDCDLAVFPWQALPGLDDVDHARSVTANPGRLTRGATNLRQAPLERIKVLPVAGFREALLDMEAIREAASDQVEFLDPVQVTSPAQLYDALREHRPDALHLRVHGDLDDYEPVLQVHESGAMVPAARIAQGLREFECLRFVFLDSCLGADDAHIASAARRLCQSGGMGAVIAYWGKIKQPTSTSLASLFYEKLSPDEGQTLDLVRLLARARQSLADSIVDDRTLAPVLYTSSPTAHELPWVSPPSPVEQYTDGLSPADRGAIGQHASRDSPAVRVHMQQRGGIRAREIMAEGPDAARQVADIAGEWKRADAGEAPEKAAPNEWRLQVTDAEIALSGPRVQVSAARGRFPANAAAARATLWRGAGLEASARAKLRGTVDAGMIRVLTEEVHRALSRAISAGSGSGTLRVCCDDPELSALPWERVLGEEIRSGDGGRITLAYGDAPGTAPRLGPPLRVLCALPSVGKRTHDTSADRVEQLLRAVDPVRRTTRADFREPGAPTQEQILSEAMAYKPHVVIVAAELASGRLILEDDRSRPRAADPKELCAAVAAAAEGAPLVILVVDEAADTVAPWPPSLQPDRLTGDGARGVLVLRTSFTDPMRGSEWSSLLTEFLSTLALKPSTSVAEALAEAMDRGPSGRAWQMVRYAGGADGGLVDLAAPAVVISKPTGERLRGDRAPTTPAPHMGDRHIDLIGRVAERRSALEALRAGIRGVMFTGAGGVGKTALAVNVFEALAEDGYRRVTIAGSTSPGDILDAFVEAFRQQPPVGWDAELPMLHPSIAEEDRCRELFRALEQRGTRVALLLDEFEDNLDRTVQPAPIAVHGLSEFLTRWLTGPFRTRLLLTCRYAVDFPDVVQASVQNQPLEALSSAEMRRLLWRQPMLRTFGTEDHDRIVDWVGGIPRALEYLESLVHGGAAPFHWVQSRMERVRARMRDQGIVGGADRSLDASLGEAAEYMAEDLFFRDLWAQLAPASQDLLAGLALFRKPVPRSALGWVAASDEAIEAVHQVHDVNDLARYRIDLVTWREWPFSSVIPGAADIDEHARSLTERVETALQQLRALGLVYETRSAFAVHGLTARQVERTTKPPPERHRRVADYWLWYWRTSPASPLASWLDEAKHHFERAGAFVEAAVVTELILNALGVSPKARERAIRLAREVRSRLSDEPEHASDRAYWALKEAWQHYFAGAYDDAERLFRSAVDESRTIAVATCSSALYGLAETVRLDPARLGEADQLLVESLEQGALGETPSPLWTAQVLTSRATLKLEEAALRDAASAESDNLPVGVGEFDHPAEGLVPRAQMDTDPEIEAEGLLRQAVDLCLDQPVGFEIARIFDQLAALETRRGELQRARDCHVQAAEFYRKLTDYTSEIRNLVRAASLERTLGRINEAATRLSTAASKAHELTEVRLIAETSLARGELEEARSRYDVALQYFADAETWFRRLGAVGEALDAFTRRAGILLERGDTAGAERILDTAREEWRTLTDEPPLWLDATASFVAAARWRLDEAEALLDRAAPAYREPGGRPSSFILERRSILANSRGDLERSLAMDREVLGMYMARGRPLDALFVHLRLFDALADRGRPAAAERHLRAADRLLSRMDVTPHVERWFRVTLAVRAFSHGRPEVAESEIRRCHDLDQAGGGSPTHVAWDEIMLSKALRLAGQLGPALVRAQSAVTRLATTEFAQEHADALVELSQVCLYLGNLREAEDAVARAAERCKTPLGSAEVGAQRARVSHARGDHDAALSHVDEWLQYCVSAGNVLLASEAHHLRGCVLAALGRADDALNALSDSLRITLDINRRAARLGLVFAPAPILNPLVGWTAFDRAVRQCELAGAGAGLVALTRARGDIHRRPLDEALDELEKVLGIAAGDAGLTACTHEVMGHVYTFTGIPLRAASVYASAAAAYREAGDDGAAEACRSEVYWANIALGQIDAALEWAPPAAEDEDWDAASDLMELTFWDWAEESPPEEEEEAMLPTILGVTGVNVPESWGVQGMVTLTMPSKDVNVKPNIILTSEVLPRRVPIDEYFEKIITSIKNRGIEDLDVGEVQSWPMKVGEAGADGRADPVHVSVWRSGHQHDRVLSGGGTR